MPKIKKHNTPAKKKQAIIKLYCDQGITIAKISKQLNIPYDGLKKYIYRNKLIMGETVAKDIAKRKTNAVKEFNKADIQEKQLPILVRERIKYEILTELDKEQMSNNRHREYNSVTAQALKRAATLIATASLPDIVKLLNVSNKAIGIASNNTPTVAIQNNITSNDSSTSSIKTDSKGRPMPFRDIKLTSDRYDSSKDNLDSLEDE